MEVWFYNAVRDVAGHGASRGGACAFDVGGRLTLEHRGDEAAEPAEHDGGRRGPERAPWGEEVEVRGAGEG